MHVIIFTLLLGALLALWVLWTTKEPYVGKRSYAVHDMANYPGGDIDSNGQWVKNIAACRTLCDANADKCFGFAINRKRDTSQTKDAFATQNRTAAPEWQSQIEKTYYDYWKGALKDQGGWGWVKDAFGNNCSPSLKVTLYQDKDMKQNPKTYGCGDHEVAQDFTSTTTGYMGAEITKDGVSAYSVPAGLKMKLFGYKAEQESTWITGSGNLKDQWNGMWNDAVKSIRVSPVNATKGN